MPLPIAPVKLPPSSKVAALTDEDAEKWLTLIYGSARAAEAMALPESLRNDLYPELYYGPAASEVEQFITEYRSRQGQVKLTRALRRMEDVAKTKEGMVGYQALARLLYENSLVNLKYNLEEAAADILPFSDGAQVGGFYTVIHLLTFQYLFTPEEADRFKPVAEKVNQILHMCHLEPLGKSFE